MKCNNVLCCSVSAAALLLAASPALAQSNGDNNQLETVVVTGIRASIEKGLENKRDATQVIESVVAEDIGKLPDNNLVEAMQRLTGVQVTDRGGGEVGTIYIRGMPDVTTTWNGRNMFTSSGLYFSVQDMPATLISKVDVYKTRSADQIETGIAGQIDVATHRPFDFDGFQFSSGYRETYNETRGSADPNASVLISDRWSTGIGEVGALLDVSFSQTRYRDETDSAGALVPFMTENPASGWTPGERIFNFDTRNVDSTGTEVQIWTPGLNAGLPSAAGSTMTVSGQTVPYLLSRDAIFDTDVIGNRQRPAMNLALQWAPTDNSVYTFEMLYDGFQLHTMDRMFFSYVDWWKNADGTAFTTDEYADMYTTYAGTNIVHTKQLQTVYNFTSGDMTTEHTNSFVYALNGKWDISNRFKMVGDVSFQSSSFEEKFTAMRLYRWSDAMSVNFNRGDGITEFGYADNSLLYNPSDWTTDYFYDNHYLNKGNAKTISLDGDYDLKGISGALGFERLKFGVRYDDRGASQWKAEQSALNYAVNAGTINASMLTTNSDFFTEADVPRKWVVINDQYLLNNIDQIRSLEGMSALPLAETFRVDEATYNAYVMADLSQDILGRPLNAEFGVRYVKVKTGMEFSGSHAGAMADAVLPSATLRYEPVDDVMLRFNYGETLRRPNFTDLNPVYSLSDDVTNIGYGTGTSGNPYLKPTRARNYDLTTEWYFMPQSAVYATGFLRKVDGLVVTLKEDISMTVAGKNATRWVISEPVNGSDGTLKGVEVGTVVMPQGLPGLLDGIGFQGSLTYLTSSQNVPQTDDAGNIVGQEREQFIGVSNWSYNGTFIYEHGPLGMRLSYVWRNKFYYGNEAASFANPIGFWRRAESSLDLQASYKLMEKAVLTFDATNLLGCKQQSYYAFGSAGGPNTDNYGTTLISRTFGVGLRYDLN